MSNVTEKLKLVHDHIEHREKTKPPKAQGSKYADISVIYEHEDCYAKITEHIDMANTNKLCIQSLQDEIKDHKQTCADEYGLDPRIFDIMLAATFRNDHFEQDAMMKQKLAALKLLLDAPVTGLDQDVG